jgi:hypothetical protein
VDRQIWKIPQSTDNHPGERGVSTPVRRAILNQSSRVQTAVPFLRWSLISGVASVAVVSLTLGGTSAARPAFVATLATGIVFFWFLRSRLANFRLRIFEIICFNCALTCLFAELTLRTWALLSGHSLVVSNALDAHRLLPGHDYGQGLHGNSLGFPGPDFQIERRPGVFRVAALGDSFAIGPTVPFENNYLTRLERTLPSTEVYNFGVSGTGPREYNMILDKHVWTYQPDFVLVSVFVGNDITEVLATPRKLDPRQYSLYLFLTRVTRVIAERWRGFDGRQTEHSVAVSDSSRTDGLSPQTFREIEARRLTVCLRSPPADFEKKWRNAESDLSKIIANCRKQVVPVGFVLIPDEFQVNPRVLQDALDDSHLAPDALAIDYPQRRLTSLCAQYGVPCLDLLPALAHEAGTYTPRDTHWNIRGNQLAGRCVCEWLEKIISRPASELQRPTP